MINICPYEDLTVACQDHEVIIMESASYGRMEQGRCIRENDFIGCENDFLFLADRWCSGRNRCEISLSIDELERANENCRSYLKMYTSVVYTCIKGIYNALHHNKPNGPQLCRDEWHEGIKGAQKYRGRYQYPTNIIDKKEHNPTNISGSNREFKPAEHTVSTPPPPSKPIHWQFNILVNFVNSCLCQLFVSNVW